MAPKFVQKIYNPINFPITLDKSYAGNTDNYLYNGFQLLFE